MIVREEGDSALLVTWPELIDPGSKKPTPVHALHRWITSRRPEGLREAVPGMASLLLVFDPLIARPEELFGLIETAAARPARLPSGRRVEIPVKYGGAEGPDLKSRDPPAAEGSRGSTLISQENLLGLGTLPARRR